MAVPAMLLAIPAGQLADRFDRRRVLATTLLLTAGAAAAMGLGCWCRVSAPWIYAMLVLNGVGQALGSPSRTALLPWIVPPEKFAQRGDLEHHGVPHCLDARSGGGRIVALDLGQPRRPYGAGRRGRVPLVRVAGVLLVRASPPDRKQSSISLEDARGRDPFRLEPEADPGYNIARPVRGAAGRGYVRAAGICP